MFGSKRFVVRDIEYRLVALLCVAVGVAAVAMLRSGDDATQSRFLVKIPDEPERPEQNRDLSKYDLGGFTGDCTWMSGLEKRTCVNLRSKARKFIFDHWHAKKKAYIEVDYYCTDCRHEEHIFIEPDENGKWQIVKRFIPTNVGYSFHRGFLTSTAVDVRYRHATREERNEGSAPKVLVFLDENGGEAGNF